jgi:hypothetical protein
MFRCTLHAFRYVLYKREANGNMLQVKEGDATIRQILVHNSCPFCQVTNGQANNFAYCRSFSIVASVEVLEG